jgi:hypothetical protein
MIAYGVLFIVAGLLMAVTFVLNTAGVASGMASFHTRNALRFPRYYKLFDWWSLSLKENYWRWWGGIVGAFFAFGGILAATSGH